MISIEQWRACIGTFNCKRGYSGFLSSLFSSSSYYYYQPRKRSNLSRELSSTADTSLSANNTLPPEKHFPSANNHGFTVTLEHYFATTATSITKPTPSSSSSASSAGGVYSLRRSLLRDLLVILLIAIVSRQLIISGDIETNPGPVASDRPTMRQLIVIKKTEGSDLRIIDWITTFEQTQCTDFAYMLLDDDVKVRSYQTKYKDEKCQFVREVLSAWLSRDDGNSSDPAVPCTWEALAQCVTDAGLDGALAKAIRDACPQASTTLAELPADKNPADGNLVQPDKSRLSHAQLLYERTRVELKIQGTLMDMYLHGLERTETGPPYIFELQGHFADKKKKWIQLQSKGVQRKIMIYFCCQRRTLGSLQHITPLPASPPSGYCLEPLEQFKEYLKHIYQQQRLLTYFKEPCLENSNQSFNLKLVERDADKSPCKDKDSILLRLHNNADHICGNKTDLEMFDIGKCKGKSHTRKILVEGPPGVGKSTFARTITQKWANGELLQEWSLVLVVQAHDQRIREAKTIHDILYHPNSSVTQGVFEYLIDSKGKNTLLILDGYDKLSVEQEREASLIQSLVTCHLLSQATVMILSRSVLRQQHWSNIHTFRLMEHFYSNIDQHIEISGFTKDNIDSYITSACSDDLKLTTAFKSYISSNPLIYSLMHMPQQCNMVTSLYHIHWKCDDNMFAPRTMTELYTDLVRTLLLRYLSTHPVHSQRDWLIDEFTDLPGEVYEQFKALAQLAARGIEERVHVFDSGVPEESLGLMHVVEEVYPGRGESMSYSFLHLTLQEYLAAYHWSLDPNAIESLRTIVQENCFSLKFFRDFLQSDSYGIAAYTHWPVLLFTIGITKDHQFLHEVFCNLNKDEKSMYLLYEAQSPLVIESVVSPYCCVGSPKRLEFVVRKISPQTSLDCFVIGYCIPFSNRLWKLSMRQSYNFCRTYIENLSKGLSMSSNRGGSGRIESLETPADGLHLLHPHTQTLSELNIDINNASENGADTYFSDFPVWYPMLKVLQISAETVSKHLMPLLEVLPVMCNNNALESLYLDFYYWSTVRDEHMEYPATKQEDIEALCNRLQACHLKHLEMKARGYPTLSLTISHKLESLKLSCFSLTPTLAQCVGMEHNALHTLELHYCTFPDDVCLALVHSLQSPHCVLEAIHCQLYTVGQIHRNMPDHCRIPDELVKGIGSCHSLKLFNLLNIASSAIEHLVAGLKENNMKTLEALTIVISKVFNPWKSYAQDDEHFESFDELIRVVNEQSNITRMKLSNDFQKVIHDHRDNLIIEFVKLSD